MIEFGTIELDGSELIQTLTLSLFDSEPVPVDTHGTFNEAMKRIKFDDFDSEAVSIAVTPVESPITIEATRFHPREWTVYRLSGSSAELVGHFTGEQAKAEAEKLQRAGEGLLIGTPYLASYPEG
ncbi:hypothetical protein RE6C_00468 [Rhodopirellula europaea 6C]|uniref:Uncharacterized protein n=1 Tax=Rhodopirellula europaea 6C TaxID=1263867 RepID=M2ANZ3_9BACT|nr:hypothetical protein RE6C_00468 [Rhodopirellula europaea 6C]